MKQEIEIWIASRLLSGRKRVFSKKELLNHIERIFHDKRHGLSTHISNICVGNIPIAKSGHSYYYNYLFRISSGKYRVFSKEDIPHKERIGYPTNPILEEIPPEYRNLHSKRHDENILPNERKNGIDVEMLKRNEKEAKRKTLLMMAYNPSCARIFKTGTNISIKRKIETIVDLLPHIKTQEEFNEIHKGIMDFIVKDDGIRDQNHGKTITYGQAQKGLNVFLKVYVDWANLPNHEVAERVRPFLHCPLDSVVMNAIKKEERDLWIKDKLPCTMKGIITYDQYFKWQELIDFITGEEKRIILDVIWYNNSLKERF